MSVPIDLANIFSVAKDSLGIHPANERLTVPSRRIPISRIPVTGWRRDSFASQIGCDLAWRTACGVLTENPNNDLRSFRVDFMQAGFIWNDTISISWRTWNLAK
jgi:hypothetical protein